MTHYIDYKDFDKNQLHIFAKIIGSREKISITYGPQMKSLAFVTPAAITNYPRLTGDGDYAPNSQYGPSDPKKARFALDLNQWGIDQDFGAGAGAAAYQEVEAFMKVLEEVDDALLTFMYGNQLKWLQRKNLSREEVRMLQIQSVKIPVDKDTGIEKPRSVKLQAGKYYFDQVGNERERQINICDFTGRVLQNALVMPGDVVCCTMHLGSVYHGVGGDKFGMSWQLEDVQIVCQSEHMKPKEYVSAFNSDMHQVDVNIGHDYTWSGNTEFGAAS